MRVGLLGLGKLGLPVAVAFAHRGHDVYGFDVDRRRMDLQHFTERELGPEGGPSFEEMRRQARVSFVPDVASLAASSEILFVAVQTPHRPEFEGTTELPSERADFDYGYLEQALQEVNRAVKRPTTVAIISTVLPGTIRPRVGTLPTNPHINWIYNPYFIAMGTVVRDLYGPEFVLLGTFDRRTDAKPLIEFYKTIVGDAPILRVSLESAELAKVLYNTFIGLKIVFANTVMELAHETGCADVDEVMHVLRAGKRRIISEKYLAPGMGDGGGCHPRDNIALSWLAKRRSLSFDLFEAIMTARQEQSRWLTRLMQRYRLPKVILGQTFKPETNITTGSPAVLCKHLLERAGLAVTTYDPHLDAAVPAAAQQAAVFLIATRHPHFQHFAFPPGSVVIDPHRYIGSRKGVEVISVGRAGP